MMSYQGSQVEASQSKGMITAAHSPWQRIRKSLDSMHAASSSQRRLVGIPGQEGTSIRDTMSVRGDAESPGLNIHAGVHKPALRVSSLFPSW